jgi:hypothetical protein
MNDKKLIAISIFLLTSVLIGVTIIEPLTNTFSWIKPFTPMIVIMGFFIFLVSTSLFIYIILTNLNKKNLE